MHETLTMCLCVMLAFEAALVLVKGILTAAALWPQPPAATAASHCVDLPY
jgi:hypothetical protein